MIRQLAHLAPLLAILTLGQSATAAAATPQPNHDMRDLTTLPQTPQGSYTGGVASYNEPVPEPLQTPIPLYPVKGARGKDARNSGVKPSAGSSTPGAISSVQDTRSAGQKIVDSIDLSYGFFLNGPSLGSNVNTTYNPWANGTWPLYIYHTVDLQYHFNRANLIGAEMSAKQDIASGVTPSGFISPVLPETTFNDPQFWYTRKGIINQSRFSMDLQFNLWPGVTDSTRATGEYFSSSVDTTWNLKIPDRRWTVYFSSRIRPYIYDQLTPTDTFTHTEWMYLSAGYYAGYNLSSSWQVNLSGVFDCDVYADSNQLWNRGDASDDRAQLELNYFVGRFARIGGYFQTVVTNLSLVSSLVGLDITINLLSSK